MSARKKVAILVSLLVLCIGVPVVLLLRHHSQTRTESLVGVGIILKPATQTHPIEIADVLLKSPAGLAGISPGWFLTKVDGTSLEGKTLREAVQRVRGPVNTSVELELVAPDGSQTNTITLVRKEIKLPDSTGPVPVRH